MTRTPRRLNIICCIESYMQHSTRQLTSLVGYSVFMSYCVLSSVSVKLLLILGCLLFILNHKLRIQVHSVSWMYVESLIFRNGSGMFFPDLTFDRKACALLKSIVLFSVTSLPFLSFAQYFPELIAIPAAEVLIMWRPNILTSLNQYLKDYYSWFW